MLAYECRLSCEMIHLDSLGAAVRGCARSAGRVEAWRTRYWRQAARNRGRVVVPSIGLFGLLRTPHWTSHGPYELTNCGHAHPCHRFAGLRWCTIGICWASRYVIVRRISACVAADRMSAGRNE